MVRTYKPKTDRANLDEDTIDRALRQVLTKNMGQREASRVFGIKRQTLQSRIKNIFKTMTAEEYLEKHDDRSESDSKRKNKYATRTIFSVSEEEMLVNYIKQCANINYGLTRVQLRVFVYEYAINLPHCKYPDSWRINKKAGTDWLHGFMRRHATLLSLRKPENTSLARGIGFNKSRVEEFFQNYKNVLNKYKFTAERIYNLDETGVTTVLNPPKIIAPKGKKQVGLISSAERGELVTVVGIISATGAVLPPVYIFPRIRNIEDFLEGGPLLSVAFGNKSGWMTGDIFVKTLEHVVKFTKCNKENKILLLLDNHESHVTLTAIMYARDNGIVFLSFPPHTSHKLQPLDIGVFGPFKGRCAVSFNDWMSSNPGKTITVKLVPKLTKAPFLESFSPNNITKSFEKPGIWPVNSLAFNDSDFDATFVYRESSIENQRECSIVNQVNDDARDKPSTSKAAPVIADGGDEMQKSETREEEKERNMILVVNPEAIRPFPKVEKPKSVRRPKANQGKSRVYTETPEKNRIEEIEKERKEKQDRKSEKQNRKCEKQTKRTKRSCEVHRSERDVNEIKKIRQVKKKVFASSSSESEKSDIDYDSETDDNMSLKSFDGEENIELNSYILVKFSLKSTVMYYIGCVKSIIPDSDKSFEVKYLRRRETSNKFYFPQVDDIESCNQKDIIAILKNPILSRRDSTLTFHYNFDGLNVK